MQINTDEKSYAVKNMPASPTKKEKNPCKSVSQIEGSYTL
jgi:hypothetical protein